MTEWLVDRSRYELGKWCEVRRFFEYHLFGTGIKPRGKSPYLLTGTAVHEGLEKIILNKAEPAVAAQEAKEWYLKEMAGEEFYVPGMLEEQLWLTQVLILGWAKKVLPLMAQSEILCVEQEEVYPIKVPWGTIVLMSRPDMIVKQQGDVQVVDFKTAKTVDEKWYADWSDSMQMMVGPIGAEQRLQQKIDSYQIHGLVKMLKGNGGGNLWTVHTNKSGHLQHLWTPGAAKSPAYECDKSPVEYVDWLDELGALGGHFVMAGPYRVKHDRVEQFLRGLATEETRWKQALDSQPDAPWESKQFQDWIDSSFPRPVSQNCSGGRYGEVDHGAGGVNPTKRCPFYNLCYKQSGWKWPLDNGFEPRVPHHQLELERQGK